MKRSFPILLSLIALVLACGGGTKFVGTWVNPEYQGATVDDVLVIGVGKDQVARGMYESALASHLQESGVTAHQSITVLPTADMLTKEQVVAIIQDKGIEGVIVTRVIDVQETEEYVPPSTTVYSGPGYGYPSYGRPYYGSYYGYYSQSYEVTHTGGYTYTNVTVTLETNLYDASDESIVWSGRSETFNPNEVGDIIKPTAKMVVDQLIDEGLIHPKK
jgi:hypothetical protein